MPRLIELERRYLSAGKTVHFVGVSVDEELESLDLMVEEKEVPWPMLCDGEGFVGEIPKLYHLTGTPTLWLIDSAGKIALESHSVDEVERRLAELLD